MSTLAEALRERLLPAVGHRNRVSRCSSAGLLSLSRQRGSRRRSVRLRGAEPDDRPRPIPAPTPGPAEPSHRPGASPSLTAEPSVEAEPGKRVATRVVIPALDIDLPVIQPPRRPDTYPLCNVAMYIQEPSSPARARRRTSTPMPGRDVPAALERDPKKTTARSRCSACSSRSTRATTALRLRDHRGPAPPADPRRRARADDRAALAPDIGRADGHARQAPGRRAAALGRAGRPRGRPPEGASGRLRLGARRLPARRSPARSSRSCGARPPRPRRARRSPVTSQNPPASPPGNASPPRSSRRSRRPRRSRPGSPSPRSGAS